MMRLLQIIGFLSFIGFSSGYGNIVSVVDLMTKISNYLNNTIDRNIPYMTYEEIIRKENDNNDFWRQTSLLSLITAHKREIYVRKCKNRKPDEEKLVIPSTRTVYAICKNMDNTMCPQCPQYKNFGECDLFRYSCRERRVDPSEYQTYCDDKYGSWRTLFIPADYAKCHCCDECVFYRELDQSCMEDSATFELDETLPVMTIDLRAGCNPYWAHPDQENKALRCDPVFRRCVPVSLPQVPPDALNSRLRFEPRKETERRVRRPRGCPDTCRGYRCGPELRRELACPRGAFRPLPDKCNCCGYCVPYQQLDQKCSEFQHAIIPMKNGSREVEVEEELLEPGCDEGLVCRRGRCQDIHTVSHTLLGHSTTSPAEPCKQEMRYFKRLYGARGHLHYNAPQCTPLWLYAPVQCRQFVCYCAMPDGTIIQGTRVPRADVSNMNCDCAREVCSSSKARSLKCDGYGNYDNIRFHEKKAAYPAYPAYPAYADHSHTRSNEHQRDKASLKNAL